MLTLQIALRKLYFCQLHSHLAIQNTEIKESETENEMTRMGSFQNESVKYRLTSPSLTLNETSLTAS